MRLKAESLLWVSETQEIINVYYHYLIDCHHHHPCHHRHCALAAVPSPGSRKHQPALFRLFLGLLWNFVKTQLKACLDKAVVFKAGRTLKTYRALGSKERIPRSGMVLVTDRSPDMEKGTGKEGETEGTGQLRCLVYMSKKG